MSIQADELRPFPAFVGLTDVELVRLGSRMHRQSGSAGTIIGERGAALAAAYVIRSGQVDVEALTPDGAFQTIARLHPGRMFGESALVDDSPGEVRLRVWMNVELLVLPRDEFLQLRQARDSGAYKVLRNVARLTCRRLRATQGQLQGELQILSESTEEVPRQRQTAKERPAGTWTRLLRTLTGKNQ